MDRPRLLKRGPFLAGKAWADERGTASITAVTALMVCMVAGGFAVDISLAYAAKTRTQAVADAAALAASSQLPDKAAARAMALEYVSRNMPKDIKANAVTYTKIQFGAWDDSSRTLDTTAETPDTIYVKVNRSTKWKTSVRTTFLGLVGQEDWEFAAVSAASKSGGSSTSQAPVDLGKLTDYLFFVPEGGGSANWQGASKGFFGDVVVDGIVANEKTSGSFDYGGTIYTNDTTLGAWQDIVDNNPGIAQAVTGQTTLVSELETDLANAVADIVGLPATPGYANVDLKNDVKNTWQFLDFQNNTAETIVIDITANMKLDFEFPVYGDSDDLIVMRWDSDPSEPGFNGEVKAQSGGAIIPRGGLDPSNFVHIAGALNASGGGSTPPELQPYFSQFDKEPNGGGFFTGYWITTGNPEKSYENPSLSNAIFVGGWYTYATKFSMTSGTSGTAVVPGADNPMFQVAASGPATARLRY